MQEHRFDSVAWWVYRRGIRPNHLTLAQIPVYAVQLYAGIIREPWLFALLQILIILLDGGDGILARRTGTVSRRGHLLDSVFDLTGMGVTLWVAAQIYSTAPSVPSVTMSNLLLVLMLINALVYLQNEAQHTKAITYTRGPMTFGIVLEQYWEGLLLVGALVPMLIGLALLFTRVALRKRIWNWYMFVTAGRRQEYKAIPRSERAETMGHPAEFPALPSDGPERRMRDVRERPGRE